MKSHRTPSTTSPRARRRTAAAVAVAALGLSGLAVLGGAPVQAADGRTAPAATSGKAKDTVPAEVVMVQANIKTGMTLNRFQSDVRTVLAPRPDFVTYNEVPRRNDLVLAPAGYAIWRTPGEYTGAVPVAWREDTWTAIAQGTVRVSNYRKIPPKRHTMLGLRYANWVTLSSVDGRTVSVVSTHVPPIVNGMPDLRRRTVKKIGALVTELKGSGPVLVGGDFNLHYKSAAYPRDVLTGDGMVPTYDALGSYFPTGDHQGMTIDYIFATPEEQIQVVDQRAVELYSDHDALVAGLNWTVDAPTETTAVTNVPSGSTAEKRLVVKQVVRSLRQSVAGDTVDLVTSNLLLTKVSDAVKAAVARGVSVRVITRSPVLTSVEQGLAAAIGTTTGTGTGVRQCVDVCAQTWADAGAPTTMLLHLAATGAPTLRVDVNGVLDRTAVTSTRSATLRTGNIGLAQAQDYLARLDSTTPQ
ncbi:hypothetical protein H5V45_17050 [Nocardioides sp. KIGAM211]|uniref:Endonuclease/exonuclease/phosphatase domain-containing protein n=1 Tax=Nocardioides luti TaxID=2761101 RepID=A0A7X0VCI0_9ACTN|nr:endonuclease/exonuclease/phosphatase family protein [Nocardioides luti]MBB6629037.1 hypothetical protein [Nocardioides luti]